MTPIEFPKWVSPHDSHIVKSQDGTVQSTPMFPDFHIDRLTGALTVLVHSAEEEAKAIAAKVENKMETKAESEPEKPPVLPKPAPLPSGKIIDPPAKP